MEDEKCKIKIKKDLDQQELISKIAIRLNSRDSFSSALNDVLEMIGQHLGVSRVYIFEDSKESTLTSNTHEWVNKGIPSQKNTLQNIEYKKIPSWKELVYGNGVLVNENIQFLPKDIKIILEPQNIKAILVFPLSKNGKPFGFIGFDENKVDKKWTMSEIELLRTISNMISSSYLREEYEQKLREKLEELEKINRVIINRELKMIELKEKIKEIQDKDKTKTAL